MRKIGKVIGTAIYMPVAFVVGQITFWAAMAAVAFILIVLPIWALHAL